MKKILLSLLVVLFGFFTVNAQYYGDTTERIYDFNSQISVAKDRSIYVIEKIVVNVQHHQINRGIYREIPVKRGERLKVVGLIMDGRLHPYFTERKGNRIRINFGNDDYIEKGIHTYSLSYEFSGAIDTYKNYEELYWNVTGNDWVFPILRAEATVEFPKGVIVQEDGVSVYTGRSGSKEQKATRDGLHFQTTRTLGSHEGFTIAIPFEKGVLDQATARTGSWKSVLLSENGKIVLVLLFILASVGLTNRFIKKSERKAMVRYFDPPKGIPPAMIRYLDNNAVFSTSTIACALVNLAMKGYIEIKSLILRCADVRLLKKDYQDLPEEEWMPLDELFMHGQTDFLILTPSQNVLMQKLAEKYKKLMKKNGKRYIKKNILMKLILFGLVVAIGVIPFVFPFDSSNSIAILVLNWIFFTVIVGVADSDKKGISTVISLIVPSIGFIFFLLAINANSTQDYIPFLVIYFVGVIIYAFCKNYTYQLTPEGKTLFQQMDGFKAYMQTAEIYRVAASDPLEAERIFCNYLPYAFAFNMENKWMKKFENILSAGTMEQLTTKVGGAMFLSAGLASMVTSSSSKSSGSYGGGSSGGGHGGGGGGGR